MAAQRITYREMEGSPRHIAFYEDDLCECGGIIRYDEHIDRVCEKCGLMGDLVIYGSLDTEYASRKIKSQGRSKYNLDFHINRDSEFDRQHDAYPICPGYTKYYTKSLKIGKVPDYYGNIKKLNERYRYG